MRANGRRILVVAVLAALVVVFGVVVKRQIDAARANRHRVGCQHNLHFMANALQRYAKDHEGQFPDTFSQLYPEYLTVVEVLICPAAERGDMGERDPEKLSPSALDSLCSYQLGSGRHVDDPPDTLLAWERGDNHDRQGRSVLYVDGRAEWEPWPTARDGN